MNTNLELNNLLNKLLRTKEMMYLEESYKEDAWCWWSVNMRLRCISSMRDSFILYFLSI